VTPPHAPDRREVLKLGAAAALMLAAPAAVAAGSSTSLLGGAATVIADARYPESLTFAEILMRRGAAAVTRRSDIGGTWFHDIAPLLPGRLQSLCGLTLQSDLFILQRLAEGTSACTAYAGTHDWRYSGGATHTLAGTIDLDGVAAALDQGGDVWSGCLGAALFAANEGHRNEQRLKLRCTMPAGRGPRYFVSWIMRWAA
jgi:hypothetical protein